VGMGQDSVSGVTVIGRLIQKPLLMFLEASAKIDILVDLLSLKPLRRVDLVDRTSERMDRAFVAICSNLRDTT
ncbi:MAG: hypothetical protein ABJL55_17880, partial [Roseibium sp.]